MALLEPLPRSPELMSRGDSALLMVDVQEKLIGHIDGHKRILWNIRRLLDGAQALGVPSAATEQYPQGLGSTVAELAGRFQSIPSKVAFSCGACPEIFERFSQAGIFKLLVVGIEAHVCVAQTVFDAMTAGYRVYVAVDAVGSRYPLDAQTALARMEASGAVMTTTEAALFEWCQAAGTPEFKRISQLVRETPPG